MVQPGSDLTYIVIIITVLAAGLVIALAVLTRSIAGIKEFLVVLFYIWAAWLVITLVLLIFLFLIYVIDTLVNFVTNLWKKGCSAAWRGMWNDIKRSASWFIEEARDEIYDRAQAEIERTKKGIEKIIDTGKQGASDAWDWAKKKWRSLFN